MTPRSSVSASHLSNVRFWHLTDISVSNLEGLRDGSRLTLNPVNALWLRMSVEVRAVPKIPLVH